MQKEKTVCLPWVAIFEIRQERWIRLFVRPATGRCHKVRAGVCASATEEEVCPLSL